MLTLELLIKQWDIKAKHPLSDNLCDVITSCGVAQKHLWLRPCVSALGIPTPFHTW